MLDLQSLWIRRVSWETIADYIVANRRVNTVNSEKGRENYIKSTRRVVSFDKKEALFFLNIIANLEQEHNGSAAFRNGKQGIEGLPVEGPPGSLQ